MAANPGDEKYMDELDEYNIEQDKYGPGGHSGKGRTKKEAAQNTNREDPAGHTRKTTQKLINNAHKHEKPHPQTHVDKDSK